ncbi:MAG TPA: FAD:protein FMN transferase [Deltaproteobacteria bacterium]|nr:FAD:protein FMN transferase [Deltaproteobacteria bacterium]
MAGGALLMMVLSMLAGCSAVTGSGPGNPGPGAPERIAVSDGWLAMGTFFEADLRVRATEVDRARNWLLWVRGEIVRLEAVYSRHDAQSALSMLNRALAREDVVETGVRVDPELESVLRLAGRIWEETGGAFDVTVGPLVDVWTRAAERARWPSVEELRRAKERVGGGRLSFSEEGVLHPETVGMELDLDAIAKGAVLDRLRDRFESEFPDSAALLNFGESSILAIGDPDGSGWRIAIRSRSPQGRSLGVVRLRNRALSVSSSVGSVSWIGDQQVSHVIDPRTGSVVEETVEAVVIADAATVADGWSTGLLVIGANRSAIRLVEKAGLDAEVLDSMGHSVETADWEAYLAE